MQLYRRLHQPPLIIRASFYARFDLYALSSPYEYVSALKYVLGVNPSYQLTSQDVAQVHCALWDDACLRVALPLLLYLFQQTPVYCGLFERYLLRFAPTLAQMDCYLANSLLLVVHDSLDHDLNARFFNCAAIDIPELYGYMKSVLLIAAYSPFLDMQKALQAVITYKESGLFVFRLLELLLDSYEFQPIFDRTPCLFSGFYHCKYLANLPAYFEHLKRDESAWKYAKVAVTSGDVALDQFLAEILQNGDEECAALCERARHGEVCFDSIFMDI